MEVEEIVNFTQGKFESITKKFKNDKINKLLNHFLKQTKDIKNWTNPQTLFVAVAWLSKTYLEMNPKLNKTNVSIAIVLQALSGYMESRITTLCKKLGNYDPNYRIRTIDNGKQNMLFDGNHVGICIQKQLPKFRTPTKAGEITYEIQNNKEEDQRDLCESYKEISKCAISDVPVIQQHDTAYNKKKENKNIQQKTNQRRKLIIDQKDNSKDVYEQAKNLEKQKNSQTAEQKKQNKSEWSFFS